MVWFLAAGLVLVVLTHTAPRPFLLDWANRDVVLWRLPSDGVRAVHLTFDDGPNPDATLALLDVLAAERVRATFFLIDRYVTPDTAPIVRRMFAEGHGVALHSDTRRLTLQSPERVAATLSAAAARIERLTGSRPCPAFRPHAGWRSADMIDGLRRIDHRLIGWGWFLWDWDWFRTRSPERLAARILRRVQPGAIVVMHDGHHKNPRADRRYTVETVRRLVPGLKQEGFEFRTICEALGREKKQSNNRTTEQSNQPSRAMPPFRFG
jgi:peptidoglycan-N-acetylglucosamine deacetylase